jgi:general stress protein CsbA
LYVLENVVSEMSSQTKTYLLKLLIGVPFVIVGVLFRPFWQSNWGVATFITIFWIAMSIGAGWGGTRRSYSLRFGLIVGTALSLCLVATVLINKYVGIGLFFVLLYVAIKSKFFESRRHELKQNPGGKRS